MAEKQWAGTTWGSGRLHLWLIRLLKLTDVRLVYAFSAVFVIPVCLCIQSEGRRIIYRYFRERFSYSPLKAAWKTYVNHCLFGQAVVDKFAMYAGKQFKIDIEGYEHFLELAKQKEGFVQLSSHVGNYEIAGYTLTAESKPFNALMFFGEKASVMENRNKMFADKNIRMIAVKDDMSHLFDINRALTDGETVSMPADRIWGSQKVVEETFLGKTAKFPLGPFSVATMKSQKVLAVNVMKTAAKRYKIYVTPLSYDQEASRKEQIQQLARCYVAELERIVRLYPTQWYNYFEFWNEGRS